jgi:transposase-like protein
VTAPRDDRRCGHGVYQPGCGDCARQLSQRASAPSSPPPSGGAPAIEEDGHIRECGNGSDDPEECSPACVAARAAPAPALSETPGTGGASGAAKGEIERLLARLEVATRRVVIAKRRGLNAAVAAADRARSDLLAAASPRKEPGRAGCPRCGGSYTTDKAGDGRPRFTCDGCRLVWTYGGDGGPYAAQPGAGWCETGVRCAKCGSEYHATIETIPPLEVCQRCSEPWPTQAPAAPSGAGGEDATNGSNEEG